MPTELSLTTNTLYAELKELALSIAVAENIAMAPGSVVEKKLRNGLFLYYQYRDLDGKTKQRYLGSASEELRELLANIDTRATTLQRDRQRLVELAKAYVASGGAAIPHAPYRVLKGFSDAGILRPIDDAATVIGTYAFIALGNLLGVRWDSHLRTNDIDIASSGNVNVAVTEALPNFEDILMQLEMGFIPVPALNPKHASTSYRVRGKELRVDLLTPQLGKADGAPKFIAALNAVAEPLRHLDFLLDEVIPALIVSNNGVILANVPIPARYALHKLIVSESRPSSFRVKAQKDRIQAMQLLEVLLDTEPEMIRELKKVLLKRGPSWEKKFNRAIEKCQEISTELAQALNDC